jgi:hypothetical protein
VVVSFTDIGGIVKMRGIVSFTDIGGIVKMRGGC